MPNDTRITQSKHNKEEQVAQDHMAEKTSKHLQDNRRYILGFVGEGEDTHFEWQNVEFLKAQGHAQHLFPMIRVIQIPLLRWVPHTSWISTNYIEIGTSIYPCLCMPLYLGWTSIMHRRWKYGDNCGLGIKNTVFKDLEEQQIIRQSNNI